MKGKTLFVVIFLTMAICATAYGSSSYIPTAYGLSARSIGMGNASTALTDDVCLPYFNPAAMAVVPESNFAVTYIYAAPNFEGGLKNGNQEKFDEANKAVSIGMVLSLDELLKSNRRIALGLNATLDGNGTSYVRFDDLAYENGYYFRYGESGFVINGALGFEIVEWFYLGAGFHWALKSESNFFVDVDLAGRTNNEGTQWDTDLEFSPAGAIFLDFEPVAIGLVYREDSYGQMSPVKTTATTNVGDTELLTLPIDQYYKDNFVPASLALGLSWQVTETLLLNLDGVWYHWGEYDEIVAKKDLVRENVDIDLVDTYVPRLGVEYTLIDNLFMRAGYSFEKSPLRKPGSEGNYILDNDKHIGTFGLGYDLIMGMFNFPVSLDAAFFHHYLVKGELESSDGNEFESKGNLTGGTATVTFRF